ncbi:hypothetical protein C8Q80DRAFT_1269239 [Daedaleopsis nitida]|nr:hypothetical protein C8Q80DRAFT_1269239 [Daedaleopsis nitida]
MHFLDLNDDSIRHVCDYLVGQHVLNLSLTSKRLYSLAIDRTIGALNAFRLEELRNFHWVVLFGTSWSRAHHVESIVVDSAALDDDGFAAYSEEEETPMLSLDSVYIIVLREPRLAEAFTALRRLTRVEFGMVSDSIVKLFPRLHTLKIEMCFELAKRHAFADLPQGAEPAFPSVRRLFFWLGPFPPAVELVRRCPNVELVHLSPDLIYRDTLELLPPASWPPLRSLCCDLLSVHSACCATGVAELKPVTHLQVPHRFSVVDPEGEDKAEVTMLMCILRRTSPVWVQLPMEVGAAPMRFWSEVPHAAPRLRCLDMKLSLSDLKEEYAGWLENVPDALCALPLVYLRVQLPPMPDRHPLLNDQWEDLRDADGELIYNATLACAHALWTGRKAAVKTLPRRCARAIPTLKFFALWDEDEDEGEPYGYTEAHQARNATRRGRGRGGGGGGDEDEENEENDLDADLEVSARLEEPDDYNYVKRWSSGDRYGVPSWRIARNGDGCRLQRLTGQECKRLLRCLDGCFDGQDVVHDMHLLYDSLDSGRY